MISLFFGVNMIYYPRCRKFTACAQFKIHNSKFSPRPIRPTRLTCPTRPSPPSLLNPPTSPTIHNSKFKIPLALFRAHYKL